VRVLAADGQPLYRDAVARAIRERHAIGAEEPDVGRSQIGLALHLSTATVKTHLQHIYGKLGVSERAAAVAEAMRRGLLE
jgi:two-component system, NarL family, nitrate/nitrite response regulator NarL